MPSFKYPCTFKHTLTGEKVDIDIHSTLPINQLKPYINSSILMNLDIQDDYVIVIAGQRAGENAPPIDLTLDIEFGTLNCETFYIRPINTSTNSVSQSNSVDVLMDEQMAIPTSTSTSTPTPPPPPTPTSPQTSSRLVGNCNMCYSNFDMGSQCPWSSCTHYQNYCRTCLYDWFDRPEASGRYPSCPSCGLDVLID